MTFETERLSVRPAMSGDADDLFRNYTQDAEVTKYLTWKPHTDIASTVEWVTHCERNAETADGFKLVLYHKVDCQAIGMLDFRFDGFMADFGYVLSKRYWNRGLMTEAMRPAIDYVFRLPHIYRIWAVHDIENSASGQVMQKLGLSYEGTIRRFIVHPNVSSKPRDVKMYSLIK